MPSRSGPSLLLFAALLAGPLAADAQSITPPPTGVPGSSILPPVPPARPDTTDFRGRHREGVEPADAALLVPRVLLFPFHVIAEYVLRRPATWLTAVLERGTLHLIIPHILKPLPDISWSPAFTFVLGYQPLFGANATVDNAGIHGHQVRVRALGGPGTMDLALQDRLTVGPVRFGVREFALLRPDLTFYGVGPRSEAHVQPRYRLFRRDATAFLELRPSHHFHFDVAVSYRRDDTGSGIGDSVTTHFDQQDPGQLPGFGPLSLVMGEARLQLDTRLHPETRSGVRLDASALMAADTDRSDVRFGVASAELEGAVEIAHPGRVLVGSIFVADSIAFGTSPVPFTYLPSLGGSRHVGFPIGRFTGPSAILAEVRYRYPIWAHLDAIWQVSVGNVFGEHFDGFDVREMTGSAGFGLRTVFPGMDALEAIVALGSNRFDEPFGVEGARIALSLNRGL